MKLVSIIIGLLSATQCVSSSRILVLIPFNSKSHKNMFVPIISELASRGHQVDVLTFFETKELSNNSNVTEVVITLDSKAPNLVKSIADKAFSIYKMNHPFLGFLDVFKTIPEFCGYLLLRDEVFKLIQNIKPGMYQVVLLDAFVSECFLPLAYLAQAPLIQVAPSHLMPWNYDVIHTHINYAQDAVFFLPHMDEKSSWERAETAILVTVATLLRDWYYFPHLQRAMKLPLEQALGVEKAALMPPVWEMEMEMTNMIFVNWHWSLGAFVRPNPPNLVEVAGLHCREPKPLPQDLELFISGSGEHGFILFSFGSTLPGHLVPLHLRRKFIEVFSHLPQRVIWKFEVEPEDELPTNVMVAPWLPQQDLLGDPRLRVFITQAGMLSLQEAAWHGAPVLAAPLIVDQKSNADLWTRAGLGLQMELHSVTTKQLVDLIQELTNNQSYRLNAERTSRLMKDQPESPKQRAAWWVEYTIRHGNTRHLRPRGTALSWAERNLIDVGLAFFASFLLILYFVWLGMTWACRGGNNKVKHD